MDKFLPSIKQKYKDRLINCEKQWPPCHSNKLVRLELVEREKGKGYCDNIPRGSLERREKEARCNYKDQYSNNKEKTVRRTSLAYNSLFIEKGGKKPVRKVLVEGDAGIGKTTLSVSISEDWSCDKLFQEFELVLLLPLRHKKVASAGSLPELLKLLHPSADVCKSVASYLEEEEAKKVLVIADGWDELSETERQEGSFLYELLFETFPLMSVVVTSRPFASAPLHRLPCIDRFVEINGFGKDDIKEYIHCEFSSEHEKACRLLEQLEDNPLVESVCSVPLNCAIVCHLWRTSEEVLPSTMTQLYTKIILNVILRNIRKKDSFKNILSLPNFDALPKELQQSFRLLCEFAFETLKKNHIVFSQDELAEFFPEGFALDEKILCFGLLQSADTILETGYGMSFHFLHLTFMEFLAALHLSEQPQSTLLEMLKLNDQCFVNNVPSIYAIETRGPLYTSDFNIVWRFFFGIKFFDYKIEGEDIHIMLIILKYFTLIGDFHWIMFPCHCAFESQNDLITQKASQLLQESSLSTRSYFSTLKSAHDFAVVLHVIATIQGYCHNNIIILSYCGVREHQIRRLTDILASKQGKLSIQELDLSGNKLSGECLSDLFHRASAAFQKDDNHIPCLEMLDSCRLSQSTRGGLSYLDLSYIPFEAQLLENLALYQKNIFSNLSTLNLKGCLNGAADTNAKVLNTFIKALSTNCPHMEQLNLSSNNLCVPGASVVAKGVSRFQKYLEVSDSILELCLDNTNLGNEGLKAFVENLDGVYNFAVLSLCGNSIHAAGISYLAEAVCSSRIVMRKEFCYSLDLSDNPLGLEGAIAIGRMLSSSHCQFTDIILCRCKLTTTETAFSNTDSVSHSSISSESAIMDISRQLCLMPQNRIIEILDVSGNSFTGEGIHTLVGIMHQCASLVLLYCSDCGITSDDLILFFNKISRLKTSSPDVCSKLYSWDLSNNKIDDRSALVVIGYLQAIFSHGFFPNFSGNCSEILKRINDEINKKFYEKASHSEQFGKFLYHNSFLTFVNIIIFFSFAVF